MIPRVCLPLLALVLLTAPAAGENIPRALPEAYHQTIAPLLTPLEPLLELKPLDSAKDTGGEMLIYERIVQVQEDGRRLAVSHWASRAVSEAGTEALERDTNSFHRKRQKLTLALAHTITPDGKRLPVREDAAFIQTPQRAADSSLYDDQAEAVVIFPDVKSGSTTELVMVEEDTVARIPGQFTGLAPFTAFWPVAHLRQVVEVPRAMADRLTITALGTVPDVKREEVAGGARVRFTWEVKAVKADRREQGKPDFTQSGPCLFLSTLRSWDEFMQWYWPQVEPQLAVGEALRTKIEEWTKDAKSRQEIVAALLQRASVDVRYAGLEFADGDLVPRPVNATWENQYGDCKDKSCLLAAMLGVKGIRAHPALINTEYPGRVERRSPDFRHFDHCIVAVEQEGGGWMFCDPTIPGLLPGMIGAADGEREVLLVKNGVEWARTPAHDYGTIRHRIEAEMDAGGGLSGWCRMEAEGSNAAHQAHLESKDTRDELLDRMRRFLSGFPDTLRVVDVKKHPAPRPGEPWRMDVYFLVPGAGAQSAAFPADTNYLPNTGNRRERQSAWPFWRERIETTARIKLPAGRVPDQLPAPYKTSSRYADCQASWEYKDGTLETRFHFLTKESAVPAADWPAFSDQMTAFQAWVDRPLALREGDTPSPAAPADEIQGFEQMPSVEGQINLVEEKYPSGGNTKLRRSALEKALALFSGDRDMLVRAGWRLASMDVAEGRPADALRRIDGFLESCRSVASAEEAAAADYIRSLALRDMKRADEAAAIWQKLSADETLSGFRRTWSHWQLARVLMEQDKAAAVTQLEQGIALHSDNEEILYPLWLKTLLSSGGRDKATAALKSLATGRSDAAPRILSYLLEWSGDLSAEETKTLHEILRELGKPEDFGHEFASLLASAEARQTLSSIASKLREMAKEGISGNAGAFDSIKLPPNARTAEDFRKAAEDLNGKNGQSARSARYAFEALAHCDAGDDPAMLVWDCVRYTEWYYRSVPGEAAAAVLKAAFALSDLLPAANSHAHESRMLHAQVLMREHKFAEARALLEPIAAAPLADYPSSFIESTQSLAQIAEAEARWEDALKLHAQLPESAPAALAGAAYHTACIYIVQQKWDDAFAAFDRLREMPEKVRRAPAYRDQIQKLLDFSADREEALGWWKSGPLWWAHWHKAVARSAPKLRTKEVRIAEIPDPEALGTELSAKLQAGEIPEAVSFVHSLVSAARVHPYYMFEFGGLMATTGENFFKQIEDECRPTVRAAQPLFPQKDKELLRQWLFNSGIMEFQEKQYAASVSLLKKLHAMEHEPDEVLARSAVIWLAATVDGRLASEEALTAGQKALDSKACPEAIRPNLVLLLAYQLNADNKATEAAAFLDKHLPGVPEDAPLRPRIKGLRASLGMKALFGTAESKGGTIPPEAFVEWVDAFKLPWLEYVNPQSVNDPLLKDAEKAFGPDTLLSGVERLKAAWLLAKAGRDSQRLQFAIESSFLRLLSLQDSEAAVLSAVDEVLKAKEWPEQLKLRVVSFASRSALELRAASRLKSWMDLPGVKSPPKSEKANMANLRVMAVMDPNSLSSLKSAGEALELKSSSPDPDLFLIIQRMVELGAAGEAGELSDKWKASQGEDEPGSSAGRLSPDGYIEQAALWRPFQDAMRDVVMKHFPECATMPEPVEALSRAGGLAPERILLQDAQSAHQLFLWAVKQRMFDHAGPGFWLSPFRFGQALPLAFRRDLAEAALKTAPQERADAEAITVLAVVLDVDEPVEREALESLMAPVRSRRDLASVISEAIKVTDLRVHLRTGAACDPLKVLAALEIPKRRSMAVGTALDAAVGRGDVELTRKLLLELPRERLLAPTVLRHALPAWKLTGAEADWKQGAATARKQVRQALTIAWPDHDPDGLHIAVELARILQEPDLIPAGLVPDCRQWLKNDFALTSLSVREAALRKDWAACAELSAKMMKDYPSWHEYKFFHGQACHHLGRKPEAEASLNGYLAVVHGEIDCAEARAMLEAMRK